MGSVPVRVVPVVLRVSFIAGWRAGQRPAAQEIDIAGGSVLSNELADVRFDPGGWGRAPVRSW